MLRPELQVSRSIARTLTRDHLKPTAVLESDLVHMKIGNNAICTSY
jgi:hypothetical protein